MHRVLLLDPLRAEAEARLAARAEIIRPVARSAVDARAPRKDVDAIIVRTAGVNRSMLESLPRLRVVGKHGVGLDNIDITRATELGIAVLHTPTANAIAVAEFSIACILMLLRPIASAAQAVRDGRFVGAQTLVSGDQIEDFVGSELCGKTVGIVGWGAIGRRVGAAVMALGAHALVYDAYVSASQVERSGATPARTLSEVLAAADVLTLHVPATPVTVGLIGSAELAAMRPNAVLINTSRGAIVDEDALADALADGTIAAAAIDVYRQEPPAPDSRLLHLDNALCTPHMAGLTSESISRMSTQVVDAVLAALEGESFPGLANPEALARPGLRA